MANKILAILEHREGKLKNASFEVASISSKLAKELKAEVEAVIVGGNIDGLDKIAKFGVNKVTHYKNDNLNNYSSSAYADAIAEYSDEISADLLILANTTVGKDLAPRLSVKINAAPLMDCVEINNDNGNLVITRPIYAGKALLEVKPTSERVVLTVRPNVFKAEESENASETQITTKEINSPNLRSRVTEFKKSEGKLDVAEADIIVSGGRGLKGPENFHLVEELADTLGAAVGASRAVVDAGWRHHREQVGQTGKTVSPSLYIACGISGAIQHLAGMSSSKYIVAINKDKDAPIFSVADYGIAGDVFDVLPALTEEIKKIKS